MAIVVIEPYAWSFNGIPCGINQIATVKRLGRPSTMEESRNTKLQRSLPSPLLLPNPFSCKLLEVISYVLLQCHNNIKSGKRNARRSRFAVSLRHAIFSVNVKSPATTVTAFCRCSPQIHTINTVGTSTGLTRRQTKNSSTVYMCNYAWRCSFEFSALTKASRIWIPFILQKLSVIHTHTHTQWSCK